jgi:phosphoribosylanthranilate isomerase
MLEALKKVNFYILIFYFVKPMRHIITQIYEVQTPTEAEKLISLGVDHIGSVIVSKEIWKVPLIKDTVDTMDGSDARSSLIPLFRDVNTILLTLDYYKPDIVHFCETLTVHKDVHGTYNEILSLQENVKKRFPEIKIMRSIPIPQSGMADPMDTLELARLFEPVSDYFLTDTLIVKPSGSVSEHQPVKGFVGITGRTCDWDVAAKLVKWSHIPVILAGGITPDNVFDGIMHVRPAGVDSCTGTNASDSEGNVIRFKKDFGKVKRFVDETRKAERAMGHRPTRQAGL